MSTPLLDYLNVLLGQLNALGNPNAQQTNMITILTQVVLETDDNKAVARLLLVKIQMISDIILNP